MDKNEFIICDCFEDVLWVSTDYEDLYFAMLDRQHRAKPTLWYRIKYAFRVLRTGDVYKDQLVFGKAQAEQLRNFLNAYLFEKKHK